MRVIIIFLIFISGCSVKTVPVEDKEIIQVNRGDNTYWLRTKVQTPIYPYQALKKRIDGCVNVSYVINSSGKVDDLKIIGAYPKDVFNKSASRAVDKYRYKATDINVGKLRVRTNEIVTFTLNYPDYSSPSKKVIAAKCGVIGSN